MLAALGNMYQKRNEAQLDKADVGGKFGIRVMNKVEGQHERLLKEREKIATPNKENLVKSAKEAAMLTEYANNLAEWVRTEQRAMEAIGKMKESGVTHQLNVMKTSKKMAEQQKRFAIGYAEHDVAVTKIQAEYDGYIAAMESNRRGLYA